MKSILHLCTCIAMAAAGAGAMASHCPDDSAQRAAITGYLTAMQDHRFDDAYDFVTGNMTDRRGRADWAAMEKRFYEGGEVDIYGIDVRPARASEGASLCDKRAVVPNILRSRDRANVHGIIEFEIYNVVFDGDHWRVDSQVTLFEEDEIGTWFPDIEIVDVGTVDSGYEPTLKPTQRSVARLEDISGAE